MCERLIKNNYAEPKKLMRLIFERKQ